MSTQKLTTQVIILRKKLAVIPVAFVPAFAIFFSMLGGGSGQANANEVSDAGFDISVPQSEATEIVESKQEAYKQANESSYMSGFNTDLVPEIDLESKTDEVWVEEKKDEFEPKTDLLSLYQEHNDQISSRRQQVSVQQRTAPVVENPAPVIRQPDPEPIVEEVAAEPIQKKKSLFHDNQSTANNSIDNAVKNSTNIQAVIHGNQEIGGARRRVKLRTKVRGTVNGVTIPANTIIYANASINQSRLNLAINNITLNNKTIPLSMTVYDATDGNPGLNLTSGVTQEEKTKVEGDIIRQTGSVISPGGIVGAVVTSAGSALGNIFSKNSENSKIQLISNYQVILK